MLTQPQSRSSESCDYKLLAIRSQSCMLSQSHTNNCHASRTPTLSRTLTLRSSFTRKVKVQTDQVDVRPRLSWQAQRAGQKSYYSGAYAAARSRAVPANVDHCHLAKFFLACGATNSITDFCYAYEHTRVCNCTPSRVVRPAQRMDE